MSALSLTHLRREVRNPVLGWLAGVDEPLRKTPGSWHRYGIGRGLDSAGLGRAVWYELGTERARHGTRRPFVRFMEPA